MPAHLTTKNAFRRLAAVLLALFWAWSVGESSLHALESQHVVCDEHGVVEDVHGAHGDESPASISEADQGEDESHASCSHPSATRQSAVTGGAAVTVGAPLTLPPVDRRPSDPSVAAQSPRGPPLLALAAKTSPPRA